MKIIKSYEDAYTGPDCSVYDEIALIESSTSYLVLRLTTYRGCIGIEPRYEEYRYNEYASAVDKYEDIEKEIKRW